MCTNGNSADLSDTVFGERAQGRRFTRLQYGAAEVSPSSQGAGEAAPRERTLSRQCTVSQTTGSCRLEFRDDMRRCTRVSATSPPCSRCILEYIQNESG